MTDIDDCVTAESAHGNRVALKFVAILSRF